MEQGSGSKRVDDLSFHIFSPPPSSGNLDLGLKAGCGSQGWDLNLEAGIRASRLGLGLRGWDLGLEAGICP